MKAGRIKYFTLVVNNNPGRDYALHTGITCQETGFMGAIPESGGISSKFLRNHANVGRTAENAYSE